MPKRPKYLSHDSPPAKHPSPSPAPVSRSRPEATASTVTVQVATPCGNAQPQRTATPTSRSSTPEGGNILRDADPAASCSLPSGIGDQGRSTTHAGNAGPKCFRISNVPLNWNEDMVHATLETIDPFIADGNPRLSLYPCLYSTQTQTALLNLGTCTEYFQHLQPNDFKYVAIEDDHLVIDSHFYELTPLNSPEGSVIADVVAVTGLAGHAFGSWRSRETHQMWLKDFLPKDIKNIRVMTYGYDSSLVGLGRSDMRLVDYRRNFIQQLENSRSTAKSRPIIFLGHSLGGILILQALVESNRNPHHKPILDSTHGIFFFGTPQQGLRTDELEMVDVDSGGQRSSLIMQLKDGSEFLENQKEDLIHIWDKFKPKVVSFYETVKTPSVRKLEPGRFARDGEEVEMVKRFSAQLFIPPEKRIPVGKNHTDIVKFASRMDSTYQTVIRHLKDCIAQDPMKMLLSVIDCVDLDEFLKMLSAVDQKTYESTIQPLDRELPEFYWIFKNCDFIQWESGVAPVLWLSGPTDRNINQVSSHIVRLAMDAISESPHFVLYFFCSTIVRRRSSVTVLIHTLLYQFICYLPRDRRRAIIKAFLRTLLDSIFIREPSRFKDEDCVDTVKKILDASNSELWDALKAALDAEPERKLTIIIDGLDRVEDQKPEFIRGLRTFVEYLLERPLKPKALLTSRPQDDVRDILDNLLCIEHDKERKECLNTLRFGNTRYDKISEEHEGSLQWLWTHEKYQAWSSTDTSDLLLVEGKPGSGKSTLTKYFKRNLLEREPLASQSIVASFFYSYREGELQTDHSNMLRSILYDVLMQDETFFCHFQLHYRKALQPGTSFKWPYDSLKKILQFIIRDHPIEARLYFIVDAIDESDDTDRRNIIWLLRQLCSTKTPCKVKIFLASRPIAGLSYHAGETRVIELQNENKRDIWNFAESFLGPELELPSNILRQATDYVVEHAQGVFVWVHLVKQELLAYAESGFSKKQLFDFLTSLPTELQLFYTRIVHKLENNNERDIKDGVKMLCFVLFTRRPLGVEEFRQALAIPDANAEFAPSDETFEDELILDIKRRIIHCGGNFLEIKDVHGYSCVQVMHQTVREFFLGPNKYSKSEISMRCHDAHATISITCIRYLMLCAANTSFENKLLSTESWTSEHFEAYAKYLNNRPFINYALRHLTQHIHECRQLANFQEHVSLLCGQLSNNLACLLLESWIESHLQQKIAAPEEKVVAKDFRIQLLHAATRMRYSKVVEAVLTTGADKDACLNDKTPLIVSAESGDEATARVLLDQEARIEVRDKNRLTALHFAAAKGHNQMIELLFHRGADKEATDGEGRTALHHAASNGHNTTVQMLIETLSVDKE
ncbi:hypothetical protein BDD12DRAFT_777518, partial [Trichophaea hybrida]